MAKEQQSKKQGVRISRDLVIAAQALRCPQRNDSGMFVRCGYEHPTNCNPRLCTWCTDFLKDMFRIGTGEIKNPLD